MNRAISVSHENETVIFSIPYASGIDAYGIYRSVQEDISSSFVCIDVIHRIRGSRRLLRVILTDADLGVEPEESFYLRITGIRKGVEEPLARADSIHIEPSVRSYITDKVSVAGGSNNTIDIKEKLGRAASEVSIISDNEVEVKIDRTDSGAETISGSSIEIRNGVEKVVLRNPGSREISVMVLGF